MHKEDSPASNVRCVTNCAMHERDKCYVMHVIFIMGNRCASVLLLSSDIYVYVVRTNRFSLLWQKNAYRYCSLKTTFDEMSQKNFP